MAMNRDMMAKLSQAMGQVQKAQADLALKTADGTAGGGIVNVVLTGGMTVQSLKIDPEAVDPEDVEMLEDLITAALNEVKSAGKTGIVGYCWGGTCTWKSAASVPGLVCAVPYYGGGIPGLIGEKPKCPVMFHWGETDHSIPLEKAKEVAAAHANQIHHFYPAGHGFNCDQRGSYHAESAKLARTRTLEFLRKHVG